MTDFDEEMKDLITKGVEKAIEKAKEAVRQSLAEWAIERQTKAAKQTKQVMGQQLSPVPNEDEGEENDKSEESTQETYSDVSKLLTELPALQVFEEKPERVFVQKAPLSISKGTNLLICSPNLYGNALKTQCHRVMVYNLHENEYGKVLVKPDVNFKNVMNGTNVFAVNFETKHNTVLCYKIHEDEHGKYRMRGRCKERDKTVKEPPDLKNWFSSYEYRSPELNTADGLEGCDSLTVNDSEEEEEVSFVEDSIIEKDEGLGVFTGQEFSEEDGRSSDKVEGNGFSEEGSFVGDSYKEKYENFGVLEDVGGLTMDEYDVGETCVEDCIKLGGDNLSDIGGWDSIGFVGCGYKGNGCGEQETYVEDSIKQNDANIGEFGELGNVETYVHDKASSEGFMGCENSIKNDDTNQVADMSDTLNFSSEPPDNKNWFSSYVYESPPLDAFDFDELRLPSPEESKTPQLGVRSEMSIWSKEENVMKTTTRCSDDSDGRKMASAGILRSNSSIEDNSHDHWGNQKTSGIRNSFVTENLPLQGIPQQILKIVIGSDREAVSVKDVEFLDLKERDLTRKPKRKSPQKDLVNHYAALESSGNEMNSPRKSLNRGDSVRKDSEGKARSNNDGFVSPRSNLDFIVSKKSSSRTDVSDDKENGKNDSAERGFNPAKKDSGLSENDGNSLITPPGACSKSLNILHGLMERNIGHHGIRIHDRALVNAAHLSSRYITGRHMLDKAINLIDEACANVRVQLDSQIEEIDNPEVNAIVDRLLQFLEMEKDHVTTEALVLVKDLSRNYPQWSHDCIAVVGNISSKNIQEPKAKTALIWMLGEYAQDMQDAPYVLESLVENWEDEDSAEVCLDEDSAEVCLHMFTLVMKCFFRRPPETQQTLGAGKCFHQDVHDRARFYYRLLQYKVSIAEGIVIPPKPAVSVFADNQSSEIKERIFDEFNSLSVVYQKPSYMFTDKEYRGPFAFSKELLEVREVKEGNEPRMETLIKWKDLPSTKATWEDVQITNHQFPHLHLEDKVRL